MSRQVEFWYEFASTYSYPAAMRLEEAAQRAGVSVRWRPFLLGPIFGAQGWNDSPFNIYPAKGKYMWRDMERICDAQGLTLKEPVRFPQNGLRAARIVLALPEALRPAFTREVYLANFAGQRDISGEDVLARILVALEVEPQPVLEKAGSDEVKAALKAQTDEAIAKGIFGAPSFTVGDELFWGNDRLEQALEWARR
ncbi:2-hydroxychromene-2-carboxylate isomerase [Parvibaculum sp.]|uniref:2-hydroxychromene-2-carboxylate isomerase n=1 Tax=Parvibaculum sp. TaxID=2024848 RepID=UPI000C90CCD4|nr:2-hydroxychromene-2-carboxylate isomerase [Parvibaculum sp.]MAB13853.1 2-hydroxychromene-2-carboxylate isomerase [Parvibaculum sp.]